MWSRTRPRWGAGALAGLRRVGRAREEKKLGRARDSAGPAKREKEERVARLGRWADGRSGPGC